MKQVNIILSFLLLVVLMNSCISVKITNSISISVLKSPLKKSEYSTRKKIVTLRRLSLREGESINRYYPYFVKSHILEYTDTFESKFTYDCNSANCHWCDKETRLVCQSCNHGYFLLNNNCVDNCPDGYESDNYKRHCIPKEEQTTLTKYAYLKAFSTGSCKNVCGTFLTQDCSCHPSCTINGTCCSDYNDCDRIIKLNGKTKCELPNCKLCDFSNKLGKCGMCQSFYFLRMGECVKDCYQSDFIDSTNYLCIPQKTQCKVENCLSCENNDPSMCKECQRGFFNNNGNCLTTCPKGFRADRMTWSCLKEPIFAWYWVYPSVISCQGNCGGINPDNATKSDCLCSSDCFRQANCCQDIEDHCPGLVSVS